VVIERDLRSEFRRALEEVTPPAPWLASSVREELRTRHQKGWRPMVGVRPRRSSPRLRHSTLLRGTWRAGSLVAGLLVVLLIAALVAGVHVWRNGDFKNRPVPAVQTPTIKQYQALVSADLQKSVSANAFTCSSFDDAVCLPRTALADAAEQHWLDDLTSSQPPARFAVLDALMRRHLARILLADQAFVAAFRAKDPKAHRAASDVQSGIGAVNLPVTNEIAELQGLAGDIVASGQGTILSYTAAVREDRASLIGSSGSTGAAWCAACQQLVRSGLASCQGGQPAACASDIADIRAQVEIFQGDLVLLVAPDSLALKAARLQADLSVADPLLIAIESALSAGDQGGLQTELDILGKQLVRIDSDAAAIVGSS
jgi:hypothetical protein